MTNWKEKGVVPDSEDEEESDSQSITDYEKRDDAEDDEFHDIDDVLMGFNHFGDGEERLCSNTRDMAEEIRMSQASSVDMIQSFGMENGEPVCSPPEEIMSDFPASVKRDQKQTIEDLVIASPEKSVPEAEVEEISRSWVRALSSASSILSSPPTTPIRSSPLVQPLSSPVHRPILSNHSERIREDSPEQTQPGIDPSDYLPRRQLRERKPVQIHPFLLEQQRYERRMKASHIQPIRIEQIHDGHDRRKRVIHGQELEDLDFQDPEEAEMGATEESQPTLGRSSPPQSTLEDSVRETIKEPETYTIRGEEDDSDQEFPDLPDLFKQKSNAAKSKNKQPPKKYSTTNRPQLPSPTRNVNKEPTLDVYDFPGSSTTNSPPIRLGNTRRPMSRVISLTSSTTSTPVWLDQSSPQFRRTTEVHTPITSAIKTISHTSPINIMSDADDPFADPIAISSSSSDSSSSSEDELVFLKRSTKHVLPASHFRLDQKRKESREQKIQARNNQKLNENRAGVALPVARGSNHTSSTRPASRISFLESDESDGPEENDLTGFLMEDDERTEAPSLFQESDLGFAIEDDRVNGMLPTPSRKRRVKNPLNKPNSKRLKTSSYSGGRQKPHSYQPRITSHLTTTAATARRVDKPKRRRQKKIPPKLSIIDIAENYGHFELNAPAFLKVAARSARSRRDLARQSPARKFIRLATREDTADAQSVLQDWRNHKIQPKNVLYIPRFENINNAYPLSQISVNQQTKLPPPITKPKKNIRGSQFGTEYTNISKIRVPRVRQLSIDNFVANRGVEIEDLHSKNTAKVNIKIKQRLPPNPYYTAPSARSAQLEASQFPINTLEPRKKTLDAHFRMGRKQPLQQGNFQLSRFLADGDTIHPSIETNISNMDQDIMPMSPMPEVFKLPRRRKRLPKRVDAGAAIYRQPSEPLISDIFVPSLGEGDTDQGKLLGLGKFGTRYPHHFDIFPLQSGVYFHKTTFLGSGRLADALNNSDLIVIGDTRPATSIRLGDKLFAWGIWNEIVSEQMGVCVDWLTEQLTDTSEVLDKPDLTVTATLILDFVQNSIILPSSELKTDFLLRMLEILEDFSSRLDVCKASASNVDNRQAIEVTTRFLVLSLRLLRMSRPGENVLALRLEEVLQKLASLCISLLIPQGLETVRKMYDDLQYLSVRENGIRNDRYLAESWVIIFHVVEAAKIPRGSFWDITNLQLGIKSVSSIRDSNTMEKLWLFTFSLLPLLGFDGHGYISSGSRQELAVDNWSLAQQLIKRVFALYATNSRQSPSFNDYCRAIVSRCHHLISRWGWWKCSGIVGALFDFFASQELANLRNEEVYKSPQFLEDLTTETPLDVDPEDRCFHIFLKIVAITIRHQRATDDNKGIRNLVARILPNHDRQFPKEEAIFHRDLASLRNHHDLLCTVYWAAPPGYRPPITLLQNLVLAARSHNEAFLINLRAWERLARFTLSGIPSSFPVDSYKPFITWQNAFFNSLLEEYVELTLVRRELQIQSDGAFQTDVDCNRKSTMSCILAVARSTIETLKYSNPITLKQAINLDMLVKMFSPGSSEELVKKFSIGSSEELVRMFSTGFPKDRIDQELTSSAIDILACYLHQLCDAEPESKSEASPDEAEEFDSQESEPDPDWAKQIQFIDDYINSPKVFLTTGNNAVFEGRQQSHCTLVAWPLFLSELLEHTISIHSDVPGFDIGLEWMVAISKPQHELRWENTLTYQLFKQRYFLLSGGIIEDIGLEVFRETTPSAANNRLLIKNAISKMQKILSDKALLASTFGSATRESIKTKFSRFLTSTMLSMQKQLQNLQKTNTIAHKAYVNFVQEIISQIRSHCSDICSQPKFFFDSSDAYWPPETDPTLYLAGLTSYTIQLSSKQGKIRNELIYYLWSGLTKSLSSTDALYSHIKRISKGAQQTDLLEFLLTDIVPSALEVALQYEAGWLACEVYLVAVSKAFESLVLSGQPVGQVVGHMKVLLQQMFNGICSHYGRFGHSAEAVHPSHQGIITVIFRFWRACRPHMYNLNTASESGMDEIFESLDGFVEAAISCFRSGKEIDLRFKHFDTGKVGNDVAIEEMVPEVQNHWMINEVDGGVDVRMDNGKIVNHCFSNGPRDLREVLEGLLPDPDITKAGASLDCYF
ncbi:hypothetical protein NHQ30_009757 [Ciborinia camelliae]|nr:hypothetical protein NHQ30_009757 [Ciborinia camelliae]